MNDIETFKHNLCDTIDDLIDSNNLASLDAVANCSSNKPIIYISKCKVIGQRHSRTFEFDFSEYALFQDGKLRKVNKIDFLNKKYFSRSEHKIDNMYERDLKDVSLEIIKFMKNI